MRDPNMPGLLHCMQMYGLAICVMLAQNLCQVMLRF